MIRRQGGGIGETFTVRKVSFGVGVERTFPLHTPIIDKIEVVTRGDVRRAKLYYLRDLRGKAAKIKEKRDSSRPRRPSADDLLTRRRLARAARCDARARRRTTSGTHPETVAAPAAAAPPVADVRRAAGRMPTRPALVAARGPRWSCSRSCCSGPSSCRRSTSPAGRWSRHAARRRPHPRRASCVPARRTLHRGDIVVFDASRAFPSEPAGGGPGQTLVAAVQALAGQGQPTDYVKRVIGLPGDHVRLLRRPTDAWRSTGSPSTEPYLARGPEAERR